MASFATHHWEEDEEGIELKDNEESEEYDSEEEEVVAREGREAVNGDDDSDSGDGDLPLATPYPWAPGDYELTLHHEPKRRKVMGSGMVYLKRLIREEDKSTATAASEINKVMEGEKTVLSVRAKALLKTLIAKVTKPKSADPDDSSSSEEESDEEEDDDEDDDEEAQTQRRILPGPTFWAPSLRAVQAPKQGQGFLYNILKVIDENHPKAVLTRQFIRDCALELPAGSVPGCMDAKEMILGALHWLSSDWESPDTTQVPNLPLIEPSLSTKSSERDLEKRTYEKSGEWSLDSLPLIELERLFFNSPSSSSDLRWISRIRFCPRLAKGKDESSIILKGNLPVFVTGKKGKTEPGEKRPYKRKNPPGTAGTAASTDAVAQRGTKSKQTIKINPDPRPQGKQLPPEIAAAQQVNVTPVMAGKQLPEAVAEAEATIEDDDDGEDSDQEEDDGDEEDDQEEEGEEVEDEHYEAVQQAMTQAVSRETVPANSMANNNDSSGNHVMASVLDEENDDDDDDDDIPF